MLPRWHSAVERKVSSISACKSLRFRARSAGLRSLGLLASYPVFTATRLATLLEISFPAAMTAIDQLMDAGILQERTGYRRNRIFVAPEVLTIVNRPFGEEPATSPA